MKFNLSIIDILNSKIKVKLIKFLLIHQSLMSEREIASILKVSHMSINRTMRELANMNFVDFVTIGKAHSWKVNRKSYAFKVFLEFFEGAAGVILPLQDLKNLILKNLPKDLVKKAVLFGSVAKGEEKVNSDIDLFLLVEDKNDKEKLEFVLEKLSNECLEIYGNRLSPYILSKQEIKSKRDLKIISEINKGILILSGKS